jgi:hypothetical protein
MRRHQWPAVELSQDGTNYFDVHHTVHDTLDRVDLSTAAAERGLLGGDGVAGGAGAGGVRAHAQVAHRDQREASTAAGWLQCPRQHEGPFALCSLTTVARLLAGRHLGQHLVAWPPARSGSACRCQADTKAPTMPRAGHRSCQKAGPAHGVRQLGEGLLVHDSLQRSEGRCSIGAASPF